MHKNSSLEATLAATVASGNAVVNEKSSEGHGLKGGGLSPDERTIQQEGPVLGACYKRSQSSDKLLEMVPEPLLFRARPQQLIAFVINDGITSAVVVPFNLMVPQALARAVRAVHSHDVFPVLHCLSDVEKKLFERSSLVTAFRRRKIRTVVLVGTDGSDHCHCGDSEGMERSQPGRSS